MPTQPLFADRIRNIAVTGSLVRIELGVMQPPAGDGKASVLAPGETLVMPLEGFAASFGLQEAIVRRLISEGVLKAAAPAGEPA